MYLHYGNFGILTIPHLAVKLLCILLCSSSLHDVEIKSEAIARSYATLMP